MKRLDFIRSLRQALSDDIPRKKGPENSVLGILERAETKGVSGIRDVRPFTRLVREVYSHGSLDAAKKLLKELLPGAVDYVISHDPSGASVRICWWPYGLSTENLEKMIKGSGRSRDDARAWLIAILEAKESGIRSAEAHTEYEKISAKG
jgi:hypothetical protein